MQRTKALIVTTSIILATSVCVHAQYQFTNGLVAHYPFNGNANNASGNLHNGSVVGAQLATDRFGVPNAAYSFNGSNSHVSFSSVPLTQVDNWTMSAWINPASLSQIGMAVSMALHSTSSADGFGFGVAGGSPFVLGGKLTASDAGISWLDTQYSFPASNSWYHVVMLRNAGITKFYVNANQLPVTSTATPSMPTSFRIGSQTGIRFFNGLVDDVRIYSRALSGSEIQQLYAYDTSFCSPRRARATALMANGFVYGATVDDPGCGYTNAPLVLIVGGGGSGATATATIINGLVVGIQFGNAGSGYTSTPEIEIASPPFVPTVGISVSKVKVTQNVVLGRSYVLESSSNLTDWAAVAAPFTAASESIIDEFDVALTGRFFRLRQVP